MPSTSKNHPTIPLALSVGMVLVVVLAALVPNTGLVAAQSNCQYSSCSTSSGNGSPIVWYAALGLLIVVAAVLGALLYLRRRRGGGGAGPVEPWTASDAGATAAAAPAMGEVEPPVMPSEPPSVPPGAGAAYLEGPDDVGAAPVAPPSPATTPAAGGEADIDSLMQELDKISGEILKRGTPKSTDANAGSDQESDGGNA